MNDARNIGNADFGPSKTATLDAAIRLASVNARIGTPGAAERLAELQALRSEA